MDLNMEILCIGNELLIGKIQNTNATWIARRATSLGISVKRITVIGDDISEIASTIKEVLDRKPKFIITTGGLGPTFDDKTLRGIAKALDRRLEINPHALRLVKRKYEEYAKTRRTEKIELTPPRIKMATLPEKAKPLQNPVGTAPGVRIDIGQIHLFVLPGVPPEMMAIFDESIEPILRKSSRGKVFLEKSLKVTGIMESTLAPLIDKVMRSNSQVYIKSHPKGEEKKPQIELHFSTTCDRSEEGKAGLDRATSQLARLIRENGGETNRQSVNS
jgi:nicotinamide-nucleotide amidase